VSLPALIAVLIAAWLSSPYNPFQADSRGLDGLLQTTPPALYWFNGIGYGMANCILFLLKPIQNLISPDFCKSLIFLKKFKFEQIK